MAAVALSTANQRDTARPAAGIFFPQRPVLRLNSHAYSQAILSKIVEAGGQLKSYAMAERMLKCLAEVEISDQHVRRLTSEIGKELAADRDRQVENYVHHRRIEPVGDVPEAVAIALDGARIQTRDPCRGQGPGVFGEAWKEDKAACFHELKGPSFTEDPHPEPPRKFLDAVIVAEMVREFHAQRGSNANWPETPLPTVTSGDAVDNDAPVETLTDDGEVNAPAWPPKRAERSCVATMHDSDAFGKMVATEAYARKFYAASRRAFLADGQRYNWTIQEKWFKDFEPIADFIHPLSYLYAAATAASADPNERWSLYVAWMTNCWQGRVSSVVEQLHQHAERLGPVPPDAELPTTDPRIVVRRALTYLVNNGRHMDYPRYRQMGLPITSAAVESLIKEINYRVKGTEKFWNQPEEAEAILQVRAALLSDDDRLAKHLENRAGSPYRYRNCRAKIGETRQAA